MTYLAGKRIVLTGKLDTMTRSEAEKAIRNIGGYFQAQITNSTDLLVVGKKPGSKLNKAHAKGIRVIDEYQFCEALCEDTEPKVSASMKRKSPTNDDYIQWEQDFFECFEEVVEYTGGVIQCYMRKIANFPYTYEILVVGRNVLGDPVRRNVTRIIGRKLYDFFNRYRTGLNTNLFPDGVIAFNEKFVRNEKECLEIIKMGMKESFDKKLGCLKSFNICID